MPRPEDRFWHVGDVTPAATRAAAIKGAATYSAQPVHASRSTARTITLGLSFCPSSRPAWPKCPYHTYHRDGQMRTDGNLGGTLTFHPNSAGLWDNQPDFAEPPMPVDGDGAHWDHRVDDDHWEQPGNLFRKMTPAQRQALFENTARAMGDARPHIKQRHVENCTRADPAYGAGVARALGVTTQQERTAAE